MLNFKDCEVSVSGVPIVAVNATVSEEAPLLPIVVMGYMGQVGTTPNVAKKNSISIDYIVETNNNINLNLAENIRNYNLDSFPVKVVVGGITGSGYLANLSLNIEPNDLIRASVVYEVYSDIKGLPSSQPYSISTGYNKQNSSGFAHYWTTYAKAVGISGESTTGEIVRGRYSFSVDWRPIYGIGSYTDINPRNVKMISAQENYSFISEYPINVLSSGQIFEEVFTDIEFLEFNNISSQWETGNNSSFKLYPASGKIIGHSTDFSPNAPILGETTIIKYY